MKWRNRIVGHEKWDPERVLLNAANPRRHPDEQWAAVEFSIEKIGNIRPVIVNTREKSKGWKKGERKPTLLDGELRCKMARDNVVPEIEVTLVDLTPDEERRALLIFDRISELAFVDREKAADVIAELGELEQDVKEMLAVLRYIKPEDAESPDDWVKEYHVIIHCRSEQQQVRVIRDLTDRGFSCRALIS